MLHVFNPSTGKKEEEVLDVAPYRRCGREEGERQEGEVGLGSAIGALPGLRFIVGNVYFGDGS